jgi:hypothetical protein
LGATRPCGAWCPGPVSRPRREFLVRISSKNEDKINVFSHEIGFKKFLQKFTEIGLNKDRGWFFYFRRLL